MISEEASKRAEVIHDAVLARRAMLLELVSVLVGFRSENAKLLSDPGQQEEGRRQETACQEYLADRFRDLGMEVDRWEVLPGRYDVVGALRGAGGADVHSLIINGHVDVVPAGDVATWPHDPWAAEVVEGKLWGRGSCDMKGGIACAITALSVLRELGLDLEGSLLFESVVDEETGGPGTRACFERGYRADGILFVEPTSLDILPVEGGLEWLRLTVRGEGGHSAVRYKSIHAGGRGRAVSAIEKMAKLLAAVGELERHWGNTKVHPLLPRGLTTINPGVIMGGSGGGENGVPRTLSAYSNFSDYCSLGLSLKYLPNEDVAEVKREFEDHISAVARTDPWLREHPPEIEWGVLGVSFPPAETPVDHPLVLTVQEAQLRVRGSANIRGMEAVTDMAWSARAGVPGLIYGPGDPTLAHGSSECVPVDELLGATEVLASVIAGWCGVGGR